jgi:hypothetical protein
MTSLDSEPGSRILHGSLHTRFNRFRGLFQYGLLHPGHRFGSLAILGTHLCPHLRHFHPETE